MKKMFGLILILASLLLMSCSSDSRHYLKQLENENNIKHLSNAEIVFFYKNISGFDSSGIIYFVLKFEEKPINFLSQFENEKDESEISFGNWKNESFEKKVNTLIHTHFEEDYLQFEEKNQINWELDYIFINDRPDYVMLPMIYFEDLCQLIIIKLVM